MLTRYGMKGASSRYRFYDYKPFFNNHGYQCDIDPLLDDSYLTQRYANNPKWRVSILTCYFKRLFSISKVQNYDLVYIEKELFPYLPYWIEYLILKKVNYVLDYDDAIFHSYSDGNFIVKTILKNKIKKLIKASKLVISGNSYLNDYAVKSGSPRTAIINDNVNLQIYDDVEVPKNKQFTIVWIGSPSTANYVKVAQKALVKFCKEYSAKFVMIGGKYDIEGLDVDFIEWSSKTEIKILKSCHVGIMPLFDNGWERGKCGFKLIQYMAGKLPIIASPVGINKEMVVPGKNGYLANSDDEWFDSLCKVYNSETKMGDLGHKIVSKKYNLKSAASLLLNSISKVVINELDLIQNIDPKLVSDFGAEWSKFDNKDLSKTELKIIWKDYFSIFPWELLNKENSIGADIGCGTGRWAEFVLPHVKKLYLIDPSYQALNIAQDKLKNFNNVKYDNSGVEALPFKDNSLDFAYSLGVLHHVPDIARAFSDISKKLKKGAPLLIYLYYSMENKPKWFIILWKITDFMRRVIVKLPYRLRFMISQIIALVIYLPIILIGRLLKLCKLLPKNWPLDYYIDKSFYVIRNDALDRFATSLENRYSKQDIIQLFLNSGFDDIKFSENEPYWCASAIKQ